MNIFWRVGCLERVLLAILDNWLAPASRFHSLADCKSWRVFQQALWFHVISACDFSCMDLAAQLSSRETTELQFYISLEMRIRDKKSWDVFYRFILVYYKSLINCVLFIETLNDKMSLWNLIDRNCCKSLFLCG